MLSLCFPPLGISLGGNNVPRFLSSLFQWSRMTFVYSVSIFARNVQTSNDDCWAECACAHSISLPNISANPSRPYALARSSLRLIQFIHYIIIIVTYLIHIFYNILLCLSWDDCCINMPKLRWVLFLLAYRFCTGIHRTVNGMTAMSCAFVLRRKPMSHSCSVGGGRVSQIFYSNESCHLYWNRAIVSRCLWPESWTHRTFPWSQLFLLCYETIIANQTHFCVRR